MISWSALNIKPGLWVVIRCSLLAVRLVWPWPAVVHWSLQYTTLIGQSTTAGVDSVMSFWASTELAGTCRIWGQYYLYSPVSGLWCAARFRIHTYTHPVHLHLRATALPPSALLPASCRGGSAHVGCCLSMLSSRWTCASLKLESLTSQQMCFWIGIWNHWQPWQLLSGSSFSLNFINFWKSMTAVYYFLITFMPALKTHSHHTSGSASVMI